MKQSKFTEEQIAYVLRQVEERHAARGCLPAGRAASDTVRRAAAEPLTTVGRRRHADRFRLVSGIERS